MSKKYCLEDLDRPDLELDYEDWSEEEKTVEEVMETDKEEKTEEVMETDMEEKKEMVESEEVKGAGDGLVEGKDEVVEHGEERAGDGAVEEEVGGMVCGGEKMKEGTVEMDDIRKVVEKEVGAGEAGLEEVEVVEVVEVVEEVMEEESGKVEEDKRMVVVKKDRCCMICGKRDDHPKRHCIAEHLPWYVAPFTACWLCKSQLVQPNALLRHGREKHSPDDKINFSEPEYGTTWTHLMNGFLYELARLLNIQFPDGLVSFLDTTMQRKLQESKKQRLFENEFSAEEQQLIPIFNSVNDITVAQPIQRIMSKRSKKFSVQSFINWRILSFVISELSADHMQLIKNFEEYKNYSGVSLLQLSVKPTGPILTADAHFHLDTLMGRAGLTGFHELPDWGTADYYKAVLSFVVANYCFPTSWPSSAERSEIRKQQKIHFSFGVHPKTVNEADFSALSNWMKDLERLVDSTRTVAVGECGMDISVRKVHFSKQLGYFQKQIRLAVDKDLTLVIHCRGSANTHQVVLQQLIESCPPTQRIHWHCYTGTEEIYLSAIKHFPNIVFGLTPFILGSRYPDTLQILRTHGIDRFVLESDAPYIPLGSHRPPNPYIIHFLADHISKILQMPVESVFSKTYSNTLKVYRKQ